MANVDPGFLQSLAMALAGQNDQMAASDQPSPPDIPQTHPLTKGLMRPFLPESLSGQMAPDFPLTPVPQTGPYGPPAVTRDRPPQADASPMLPSQNQVASSDGSGAPMPPPPPSSDNPYATVLKQHHDQANATYDRAMALARQAAAAGQDPSAFIEAATAANKIAQGISKEGRDYLKSQLPPQTAHEGEGILDPRTGQYNVPIPKADKGPTSVQEFEYAQTHGYQGGYNDFRMEKTLAGKGGIMAADGKAPDESLSGMDYLAQFPKNTQASVMSLLNGETMPSGRLSFDRQAVKDIASRVGRDIGEPMDDTSFAARKKILTDLSSSSPSSLGGQNKAADTALQHANGVLDVLDKLHSAPGAGNAYLSRGINWLSTLKGDPNQKADFTALDSQLTGLGQEMTKMFAGSPGAEAERLDPLNQFPKYGTPQEQADYISTQVNRIMARVNDNEYQTHKVLGERLGSKNPALSPEVQSLVAKDMPEKTQILRKRGDTWSLGGGPSEPPPQIGASPPSLRGGQAPAAQAVSQAPNAGPKKGVYVPGKGIQWQ